MRQIISRLILAFALMAGIAPAIAQPAPVPALPDTERRTSYTISNSTCACAVNFALYGDGTDYTNWIEVWVNGVRQTSGWAITSPSGLLSNIARPITDAVLTFSSAQTGTVQIVGARRPRRTSQFSEGRSMTARDINQALTDIVAQNRETWDKINDVTGRTVLVPPGETLAMLPLLASRANMGACFDPSGNLTTCTAIPSGTFIAGTGITFTGTNPTTISAPPASITFTQNGTGAVPITLSSYLQTIVTPEQFGALCNGTGDDGPAINRAINSTSGKVQVVLSPTCVYRVATSILINKNGVSIVGAGRNVSFIDYEPGANGTLFQVGDGSTRLYWTKLSGFTVVSNDTTHTKIAFKMTDISESSFSDLACRQTIASGGTWQGAGSTCLQTNGRDTTTFENLVLYAEQPIVLNLNPNTYLSTDHFVFRDLDLVANGYPCVTASDGIVMTNTTFEGRQTWALCTYGFFANDSLSTQNWNNLSFSNVRTEQATGGSNVYSFFISPKNSNRLIGLTINNSQLDTTIRGVYLRNVQNATIQNTDFACGGASPVALDINSTTDALRLVNNKFETACTFTPSNGVAPTLAWSAAPAVTGSQTIPADAFYTSTQTSAPMFANAVGMPKITGTGVAPGAGKLRLEVLAGTNAGTCKIVAYAGTSTSAFTVLDNIGGGC